MNPLIILAGVALVVTILTLVLVATVGRRQSEETRSFFANLSD